MNAEYVNWCCEELLRKTRLTKATVRRGEEDASNTWFFTLECEMGKVKQALSYAALLPQWERMRDKNLFYNELEIMACAVVDAAMDTLVKLKGCGE